MVLNIAWHNISSQEDIEMAQNDPTVFEMVIPLLFLLMVINYVIFKIMLSRNWMSNSINLGILQQYMLFVVSVIITCIISFPIGRLYFFLIDKLVTKISSAINMRIKK
jgi:hypothetical protein